jgi:hypothetical protein
MGWFDWFSSDKSDSDPLRKLDPKLREFLERESPIKVNTPTTPSPPPSPPPQHQQPAQTPTPTESNGEPQQPAVPRESLFPDGRYAHIWKTYRPLAEIEAETKTDSEKLSDIVDAFKERKGLIGKAALENCAEEQMDWNGCMKSGNLKARMTMCREEVQKFERCYNAQSRLLKALGYLSVYGRGADIDEEIQMRADALYHRMMAQEREAAQAKAEGREPAPFKPLFEASQATGSAAVFTPAGAAATTKVREPGPVLVAKWKEQLEKLPVEQREAEEQALRAEYRAKAEFKTELQTLLQQQSDEREKRKAEGKETITDRFKAWRGAWGPLAPTTKSDAPPPKADAPPSKADAAPAKSE